MTYPTRLLAGLLAALLAAPPSLLAQDAWSDRRPDALAPQGVRGDMALLRGEALLSYRFGYMEREDLLFGSDRITTEEILEGGFDASSTRMRVAMHTADILFAPHDLLTLSAKVPFLSMRTDYVADDGGSFSTVSNGPGDVELGGTFRVYDRDAKRALARLVLSLPTGSISARDVTTYSAPEETILPYPMQRGTGSFSLTPVFTFKGQDVAVSWGVQVRGTIHLDANHRRYRVGDHVGGTVWAAIPATDWLSISGRLKGAAWSNGRGADPTLLQQRFAVPETHEDRQAGERIDLSFGTNLQVPSGLLGGHRLGVEFGFPLRQDLDGPQLETDWVVTAGWSYAFGLFGGA